MGSLDEIRAKLAAMDNKGSNNSNQSSDKTLYPHWNIKEGESATVRFLPDANTDNTFFWVERQMIRLPFPGVKGQDESRAVTVQVPCGEMYGDNCPVLTEVRPWFKDPSLEDMGRKYWKKRSYVFQGFVCDDPLDEETPENPIRKFMISPQIFNIIKGALMDPDMENIPTDYVNGTDFRIIKTQKGQYADYSTSNWARRERSLDEDQLAAIDTHGLVDLATYLPERPSAEHYAAISEMFEASVNGDLYDPERWYNFYRPYGIDAPATTGIQPTAAPAQKTEAAPAKPEMPKNETVNEAEVPEPVTATASADEGGKKSAEDILSMIKARKNA